MIMLSRRTNLYFSPDEILQTENGRKKKCTRFTRLLVPISNFLAIHLYPILILNAQMRSLEKTECQQICLAI